MKLIKLLSLSAFLIVMFTGCDRLDLAGGGASVAVIDLIAISEATGEDKVVKTKMEIATTDLNSQLTEAAAELEKEVVEKKEKLGSNPSQEQTLELQQFALRAGQQLKQNQAQAQQKLQGYKTELLMSWRKQIQPAIEEVASKYNAKAVLAVSPSLMWFDSSVDITADVIDVLRAQTTKEAASETKAPEDEAEKSE